jgi:hypothetical protein
LRTFNVPQRRGLCPVCKRREAHAVRNIGDGIAVCVNLELVQRVRREGYRRGWHLRLKVKHVENQDRFAVTARFGEDIQVGQVEPGVAVGKAEVRARVMV